MSSQENKPRRDHERSDWDLRYVVWGSIVLVVSVAVMLPALWWIFKEFQSWAGNRQMGTAHVTEREATPPEPRLQVGPTEEWTQMLARERAILNSYRWIDRSKGIVHIPIDRAMQLIVERGLPAQEKDGGQPR
jgi:hypothetical protein